jgi:hypothetical protein
LSDEASDEGTPTGRDADQFALTWPEALSGDGGGGADAAGQLLSGCADLEEGCPDWALDEGCLYHGPSFMFERCRKSCGVCGQPYITDVPDNVSRQSVRASCRSLNPASAPVCV